MSHNDVTVRAEQAVPDILKGKHACAHISTVTAITFLFQTKKLLKSTFSAPSNWKIRSITTRGSAPWRRSVFPPVATGVAILSSTKIWKIITFISLHLVVFYCTFCVLLWGGIEICVSVDRFEKENKKTEQKKIKMFAQLFFRYFCNTINLRITGEKKII